MFLSLFVLTQSYVFLSSFKEVQLDSKSMIFLLVQSGLVMVDLGNETWTFINPMDDTRKRLIQKVFFL